MNKINKHIIIDTDTDFDDITALLWSLIVSTKFAWRTIGCGYSSPVTVRTNAGGNGSMGGTT